MKFSLIIITYNRKKELEETIHNVFSLERKFDEVIIINNGSTDGTEQILNKLKRKYDLKIINLSENLGVAGGRNIGIKVSSGDILTFLDDDAIFGVSNPIEIMKHYFFNEPKLGILAFRIKNFYTKEVNNMEFPSFSLLGKRRKDTEEFYTSYYIGAGHAIKREVFAKCGLYPDYFFYGGEELYLAFKAINNGFTIKYTPKILVYHKVSPFGRISVKKKWFYILRNKLIINYKFLPIKYRIVNNLSWFIKTFSYTKSLQILWQAYRDYLEFKKVEIPERISADALKYLKKYEGRLYH